MRRICLDRFEGEYAVLEEEAEDGTVALVRVDRSLIVGEAREGDVLSPKGGRYETDREATRARREAVLEKIKKLRRNRR